MLHEGLGCVALWRDFPARLAAATGFGVLAYSRAGYGRSDPVALPRPLDYMTREAREDAARAARRDRLPARRPPRPQRRRLDRGDLRRLGRGFPRSRAGSARAALLHRGERPRFDRGGAAGLRARRSARQTRANTTPTSTTPFAAGATPGSTPASRRGTSPRRSTIGASPRWRSRGRTTSTARWRKFAKSRTAPIRRST